MRFVHHLILVATVLLQQHHHAHHTVKNDSYSQLAECESGHNPNTNTGNGFYGAFQFDLQTWRSLGRIGLPSDYSYAYQKAAAKQLFAQRGSQPWPVCGRYL